MTRITRPTKAVAIRETLANAQIKANVKVCHFSVRVVVIGTRDDAMRALDALNASGLIGCTGEPLEGSDLSSDGDRHQVFVYARG